MSITKLALGALIIGGMIFTVWDYRTWKKEETNLYGLGKPVETGFSPALGLEGIFTDQVARIRVKYPGEWKMRSNPELEKRGAKLSSKKIEVMEVEMGGVKIAVSVQEIKEDLPVVADRMAVGISQERDYITSATAAWTILTWEGRQVAVAKRDNRLYTVEVTCEKSAWKQFSKTFEEVYRQIVLL